MIKAIFPIGSAQILIKIQLRESQKVSAYATFYFYRVNVDKKSFRDVFFFFLGGFVELKPNLSHKNVMRQTFKHSF